jgi:outer membrane protein OmpA-like peptidoglycan-associated protein
MERSLITKWCIYSIIASLFTVTAPAQTTSTSDEAEVLSAQGDNDSGTLSYSGDSSRISIGYDSEFDLYGEFLQVFGETESSAWIGQGWLAEEAGGLQLNYHWLSGSAEIDENGHINKVFVALDQNEENDRKLTLGYGLERENYFLSAYVSGAITDERFVGQRVTPNAVIDIFEHPYDYGVGVRAGRFYEEQLVRLRAGLDYEWGNDADADQFTVSLDGEKFFYNSPHSLALHTEYLTKSGDYETDDDDFRVRLLYRYSFGQSYRPVRTAATAPVPVQQQVIQNDISLQTDAFFDLDRATLRPDAMSALDGLIAQLQSAEIVGDIRIIGHTCDLGSTPYNQRLSERRAASVREYFAGKGFDPATLVSEGRGELEPRFPNDGEPNRRKNRRVDIVAMTMEAIGQPAAAPIQVRSEPVWIQRGLRNPVEHKRTVDVYRIEANAAATGPDGNTPPVAVDDAISINQDSGPVVIDVLANDSDVDGDPLIITAVTQPANGSVVIDGNNVIYTPASGFVGTDTFIYTIEDGNGGSDTATVTVTVNSTTPPVDNNNLPVAVDDNAVTNVNTPVTIDVLANDSDPDGDTLTVADVSQPANGSVVINNGNDVTYTPNPGFIGTDTFMYTAADGNGGTDTATVTVRIPLY